jgi:D-arabinitol dehydrogenase (NADP+)
MTVTELPKTMRALQYSKPLEYALVELPLPKVRENDVLIKVKACGVCGTDLHIHEGEFIAQVRPDISIQTCNAG